MAQAKANATTEPEPATKQATEPEPATKQATEPDSVTKQATEPDSVTKQATEPDSVTKQTTEPEPATKQATEPEPATKQATEPTFMPEDKKYAQDGKVKAIKEILDKTEQHLSELANYANEEDMSDFQSNLKKMRRELTGKYDNFVVEQMLEEEAKKKLFWEKDRRQVLLNIGDSYSKNNILKTEMSIVNQHPDHIVSRAFRAIEKESPQLAYEFAIQYMPLKKFVNHDRPYSPPSIGGNSNNSDIVRKAVRFS